MLDNSLLFTVTIVDNSGDPIIYTGHRDNLPWVLLCEFQDRYFIYSWSAFCWKSISREEFIKYRAQNQSLVIQTGLSKSWYLEIPVTSDRPSKLDNSEVKTYKQRKSRAHAPDTSFAFSETEAGLKKLIAHERLLNSLKDSC